MPESPFSALLRRRRRNSSGLRSFAGAAAVLLPCDAAALFVCERLCSVRQRHRS
ncbi:DUF3488 domain-containing protein [Sesbania bispinosa]|nr:DUF3488 domain-containing protein [Sesbania bispinosa]